MDALAQLLGISPEALTQIIILAVALVIVWFLLRLFLKLTASIFRLGCLGIFLLVGAVYLLQLVGQ